MFSGQANASGPYNPNYDYAGAYQNAVNQYGQAAQQTQARQGELQNYQATMPDLQKVYQGALGGAQQMYGFNPQDLAKAQKVLAQTQTTLANLPQAVQQQGNYYGTTAGQVANNYAQQSGVLQNVLAGQTNAVGQYQSLLGATQAQAQQEQAAQAAYEQNRLGALQNLVANALGFQTQQQNQEGVTQTQMSNYGGYLNALRNAQAAMVGARGQAASGQAALIQAQQAVQQYNAIKSAAQALYGNQWASALGQMLSGGQVTVPQAGRPNNSNSNLLSILQGGGGGLGASAVRLQ